MVIGRVRGCNPVGLAHTKRFVMPRDRKGTARYEGGGNRMPWQRGADRRERLAASAPRSRTEDPEVVRLRSKKNRLKHKLGRCSEGTSEREYAARDYAEVNVCAWLYSSREW